MAQYRSRYFGTDNDFLRSTYSGLDLTRSARTIVATLEENMILLGLSHVWHGQTTFATSILNAIPGTVGHFQVPLHIPPQWLDGLA